MSKQGYCPICKGSVRRHGKRQDGMRLNVICDHFFKNKVCSGSGLWWSNALHPSPKYKINIIEVSSGSL